MPFTSPAASQTSPSQTLRPFSDLEGERARRYITPPWLQTLIKKTEELGQWRVEDIDLSQDIALWRELSELQRQVVSRVLARFFHGEGQVEVNLDPLIARRQREGREDEANYIRSFRVEESKHRAFFGRYIAEVIKSQPDEFLVSDIYLNAKDSYSKPFRLIFDVKMPRALMLLERPSWRYEVRALVIYMLVCEGTLAEMAYYGFGKAMSVHEFGNPHKIRYLLPGLIAGLDLIRRDEARHVAYGVGALGRCVKEYGLTAQHEIVQQLFRLIPATYGCVGMVYREFEPFPFPNLDKNDLRRFALGRFWKRAKLVRSGRSLDAQID